PRSAPGGTDFDRRQPGIALTAIGANGKPAFNPSYVGVGGVPARPWLMDGAPQDTTGTQLTEVVTGAMFRSKSAGGTPATLTTAGAIATAYGQWYTDVAGVNQTIQGFLNLNQIAAGTY